MSVLEAQHALQNLIQAGNCVAWIGSGLSRPCYPSWHATLQRLCDACGITGVQAGGMSAEELIDLAQHCQDANASAYSATLAGLFGIEVTSTRRAYHLALRLGLRAYVTTNFDPLLSTAAIDVGYTDLFALPDLPAAQLGTEGHPLFYLHGIARHGSEPRGDGLILSRRDFEKAYDPTRSILPSFLEQLLTYHSVFFLGCSLTEPEVQSALKRVRRIHKDIRAKHSFALPKRLALLPEGSFLPSEDELFAELDVEVVRYNPESDAHFEVEKILIGVCEANKLRAQSRISSGFGRVSGP